MSHSQSQVAFVRRTTQKEVFSALRDASEAQFDQLIDSFAAATDPAERAVRMRPQSYLGLIGYVRRGDFVNGQSVDLP